MNIQNYFIILLLTFFLGSCNNKEKANNSKNINPAVSNDLQLDHFNIWVKNPAIAKERLAEIGFNPVPDSLSEVHHGQGTTGRFVYFLNGYLELIFVYDPSEMEDNCKKNRELDFMERSNFDTNGASPFGLALKVKDYNIEKIPFQKVRYHQDWMEDEGSIFSAKNSKTNLNEPSIFVVYPQIEYHRFESLSDVRNIPDEYAIWRQFYMHPNGAKRITNMLITSTHIDLNTETMKALNGMENVTVQNGKQHLMEITLDSNIQGKSFDLRPDLPLLIHL